METLLARGFALSPTFTIYVASRDFMRMRRAEWHDEYTMPSLWDFFRPNRNAHGSYWFYWTLEDEIAWKENYRLWMQFVNEYKNRGGRVSVGSDAGYIYSTYGFGYITELALLREAGFTPLEVLHAATLQGARVLGIDDEVGSIAPGKKADLVVIRENPLENLHVLYGTGALRLNDDTQEVERVGGIDYTIRDGIVYDARALLDDVADLVRAQKAERGIGPGPMPVTTAPSER
ncbi:MAG: amidohydrolase family protein [Woeseiaceae bacterium]|nr:amidohydrolase family protein [Woeseiaceae bacterium]